MSFRDIIIRRPISSAPSKNVRAEANDKLITCYFAAFCKQESVRKARFFVVLRHLLNVTTYVYELTAPYDALKAPGKVMSSGYDAFSPSAGEAFPFAGKVPAPIDKLSYPDGMLSPYGGSVSPYREVLSPPFGRSSPPGYAFPYPYDVILPYVDIVSAYADTLSPSLDVVSAPYDVSWMDGDSLP